jgi:hypothetical protein
LFWLSSSTYFTNVGRDTKWFADWGGTMKTSVVVCCAISLGWAVAAPECRAGLDTPIAFTEAIEATLGGPEAPAIRAEGNIDGETVDRLRRFLAQARARGVSFKGRTVFLHSPGGNLGQGVELGRVIRQEGLNTALGAPCSGRGCVALRQQLGICASACTFAFLGGVKRTTSPGDVFAMHRFYAASGSAASSDMAVSQLITVELYRYVREMGVDQGFVELMVRAGNESFSRDRDPVKLYYPSPNEMAKLRIVTETGPEQFSTVWTPAAASAGETRVAGVTTVGNKRYGIDVTCDKTTHRQPELWATFSVREAAGGTAALGPPVRLSALLPVTVSAHTASLALLSDEYKWTPEGGIRVRITDQSVPFFVRGGELTLTLGNPLLINSATAVARVMSGEPLMYQFGFDLEGGRRPLSELVANCR